MEWKKLVGNFDKLPARMERRNLFNQRAVTVFDSQEERSRRNHLPTLDVTIGPGDVRGLMTRLIPLSDASSASAMMSRWAVPVCQGSST